MPQGQFSKSVYPDTPDDMGRDIQRDIADIPFVHLRVESNRVGGDTLSYTVMRSISDAIEILSMRADTLMTERMKAKYTGKDAESIAISISEINTAISWLLRPVNKISDRQCTVFIWRSPRLHMEWTITRMLTTSLWEAMQKDTEND